MKRDAARLAAAVEKYLGPRQNWAKWGGGYPHRPDLALVDAVMSIQARYGKSSPDSQPTGVRGAVARYRAHTAHIESNWVGHLAAQDPDSLLAVLGHGVLPGGARKAAAIVEAAERFHSAGVFDTVTFDPHSETQRRLYTGVKGLGKVTWEYFGMLLEHPGVKVDTWVGQFVALALGRILAPAEAGAVVKDAADLLGAGHTELDHAIWDYGRRTRLMEMRDDLG